MTRAFLGAVLAFYKSDEGYNLHAATTGGAQDERGREALRRYVLRPPVRRVTGQDLAVA